MNRSRERCCLGRGLAAVHSDHPSTIFYALRAADSLWEPFNGEGTVFGSINKGDLSNAAVPWPGADRTAAVEVRLAALDSKIHSLVLEIERLERLRDTLLPELLSGRIRVPEAKEAVA